MPSCKLAISVLLPSAAFSTPRRRRRRICNEAFLDLSITVLVSRPADLFKTTVLPSASDISRRCAGTTLNCIHPPGSLNPPTTQEHGFSRTYCSTALCSMCDCTNHYPGTDFKRVLTKDYRRLGLSPSQHRQVRSSTMWICSEESATNSL